MTTTGSLPPGAAVGSFTVEALIGRGGMGEVYRAVHRELGRPVALKLLLPALAMQEEFAARFVREARVMQSLDHPCIVTVLDAGDAGGRLYLAMRLVTGISLKDRLAEGLLPPEQIVSILEQLAEALDYAHSRGVIHRDIKPSNILIDPQGQPVLVDFGLAKALGDTSVTVSSQYLGTPTYMAPEQASGDPIGHRADLYSLACVAFEMLTGTPPYTEQDTLALLLAHGTHPVPRATERNPDLPLPVNAVVQRALAKSPTQRYPSAGAFVDALKTALPADRELPRATRPGLSRRTFLLAGLGSAAVLVAGGTAVVRNIAGPGPQPSPRPAAGPGVRQVAAGATHNLVLLADGTVKAWGFNGSGQLGDGTTASRRSRPVALPDLTGVIAVDAGDWHSMALLQDGTVRIWGDNQFGELGDGTTTNRSTPTALPDLIGVTAIAVGGFLGNDGRDDPVSFAHTLALLADGTVRSWGSNNDGQLGDGTTTDRLAPAAVPGLTGVSAVAAGGTHSLALRTDGTVLAWGDNGLRGPTGRGASAQPERSAITAPVAIPGLADVTAISAGNFHSLALLGDGTVRAWGWNAFGQLGDGTTDDRPSPVTVSGLTDITAVAAGDRFSLALRRNGRVTTWGANERGQLGNGTFDDQPLPVDVLDLTEVTTASTSTQHSLVLLADGTVMAWGWNAEGQLGDGTADDQAAPVEVSSLTA
jgi:alpha-tubulin suppressor-like RCC1 family protein